MSPTYQVTCTQCGKEKWPTAPMRPLDYVCALCVSVGPVKGVQRREAGKRARATRKSRSQGAQGPTEPQVGLAGGLQ